VKLRDGREYLLRLRNELHFHAGGANDTLDRTEQLRLATENPPPPVEGLHPVELFMREYFQYTSDIRDVVAQFRENSRPRTFWQRFIEPLGAHHMEGDFLVGPAGIAVNKRSLPKVQTDVGEVLRMLDLANLHDKRIEQRTWESIRRAMADHPPLDPNEPLPPAVAQQFLLLMSQPGRLGEVLRWLHALRVLEQIIPAFKHARGLLQFNDYHKYTVDEHSLRAVESLSALHADHGPAGEVYRALRNKRTVHLAALLHDLGKGYPEDHSEVGKKIAAEMAERLYLPESETESLVYLVHKHLLMSHVAQRLDINDDIVVANFARDVGSLQNLQMLYVLTCCDLDAVGPGVLNDWRLRLITDLYNQTQRMLTSDSPETGSQERIDKRRGALRRAAEMKADPAWWDNQIANLPVGCMFGRPPEEIVAELDRLRTLPHRQAIAWGRYLPDRKIVEYTVGTYEEIAPGIFHRLTGALTSQRQQILSAEIHTLADGMVLDRFYVQDPDYSDQPPPDQIELVSQKLLASLATDQEKPPVFRKTWQDRDQATAAAVQTLPARVAIDNSTAANETVISVFAYDRMGLLYSITRRLFELKLSVRIAKIGTHLDQVVDVFYVVDEQGKKIEEDWRLEEIERQLIAAIDEGVPT
jgi:[protein-PII] uridylyltransferase